MSRQFALGCAFRTCENFWDFADFKSSLNPKNSYKYKSHTAITSIVVALATNLKIKCESLQKFLLRFAFAKSRISLLLRHCEANLRFAEAIQTKIKSARSANLCKSFCYFLLSQKVESPLPLNSNLPSKVDLQNPHSRFSV